MKKRKNPDIPFVNLHSHTTFSIFDGLGYPEDHMEYIWENGLDAYAVTDHGTMAALPYQVKAAKRFRREGKDIKPIYGVEAYVIPSLENWRELYEQKGEDPSEINATIIEGEGTKKKINNKLRERRHMVLLAQNQEGLENLFKLISDSYKEENFYYFPRMDYEMLGEYSEGVISTSSCLGGLLSGDYWQHKDDGDQEVLKAMSETAQRMKEIYGDRFYAEIQWNAIPEQHELNKFVIEIAKQHDLELVSNADAHYYRPEVWKDRELYKQLGWLGEKNPQEMKENIPDSRQDLDCELYPKNGDQMFADYRRYSQQVGVEYDDDLVRDSIEKTHEIAHERIEDFYPDDSVKLPDFAVPEDKTPAVELRERCIAGLQERKGGTLEFSKEYLERLERELEVIEERGFSKYFLTMDKIVEEAKDQMLTGPARGSAGGALTAYLLGITDVDPIEYGLLFSRFLRKDGDDYPDIDTDVADRDKVREHMIEKWGEDAVAAVSNFNTLKVRSLVKDIAKYHGVEFEEVNAVTSVMLDEARPQAKEDHGIEAGFYEPTFEECKKYSESFQEFLQKYPEVEEHIEVLEGQISNVGRHAGGLIITENLDEKMPLITSKGARQTPWSEGARRRDLEPLGFIKFDLLGLDALEIFQNCIAKILPEDNPSFEKIKEFYDNNLHPDVIDMEDEEVYKSIFHEGNWGGIFQFTSEGMQQLSQRFKPDSIEEIAAVSAIYRPGPLNANVDDKVIDLKQNPEKVEFEHPLMEDITGDTYGLIFFQEQIMQTVHKLGKDITLDEGDLFRKILTKKGLPEEKKKKKESIIERFIEGCMEKGLEKEEAHNLLETMQEFSKYGFNLSHSTAYSIISYQCAYLMHHYPAEWVAGFLDNEDEGGKEEAVSIAESHGFDIQLPDINESSNEWEVGEGGDVLYQPITDVKWVADKGYEQIEEHRPFDSLEELLFNDEINYRNLDKRVMGALSRVGGLDSLMQAEDLDNRRQVHHIVYECNPDNEKQLREAKEEAEELDPFTKDEEIESIIELTGTYPIEKVVSHETRQKFDEFDVSPLGGLDPVENGNNLCWFVIKDIEARRTRNAGRLYWVVRATDTTGETTSINIWNANEDDPIKENEAYMSNLDYEAEWGYSLQGVYGNLRRMS